MKSGILAACIIILATVFGLCSCSHEPQGGSARWDLVQRQQSTGLSIAWVDFSVHVVHFRERSDTAERNLVARVSIGPGLLSPSGTRIAVEDDDSVITELRNGGNRQSYYSVNGSPACWSPDEKLLAIASFGTGSEASRIKLLNLTTRQIVELGSNVRVTSQCWSPDGKKMVYWRSGRIY